MLASQGSLQLPQRASRERLRCLSARSLRPDIVMGGDCAGHRQPWHLHAVSGLMMPWGRADNPQIWTNCRHHFHLACIYEWCEPPQAARMASYNTALLMLQLCDGHVFSSRQVMQYSSTLVGHACPGGGVSCMQRHEPVACAVGPQRECSVGVVRLRRLERKETCPICDTPMSFEELLA